VTIWGDQFDKLLSYLKKGSSIVVFGEVQKPDIYMDREGKPQISLEITAALLQFSPFGKSEKEGASSGQSAQAAPQQQQGMDHSAPVNPYMKAPSNAPAQANPYAPQGNTYDDEVPF
jgi:single-strand DNA-binding protein